VVSPQPHRRSRAARRTALAAGAVLALGGIACVPLLAQASPARAARTLTVAADGSAAYRTVQAAIDAASPKDTISVAKGTYHEVVTVPAAKSGLTLVGATGNPADIVITYGNSAGAKKPGGGQLGTAGSATATFAANDLTVRNITVVNSYDKAAHPGASGGQAVAVNAEGDRQVYENDALLGHQDTLLAWESSPTTLTRQYFHDDRITGDTDFIFGDADAVFDHDTIVARDEGAAAGGLNGFITAANTDSSQKYGFLIANSTVSSTAKANTYYLGRPWHPSANAVAQVLFRNTVLPAAVKSATPTTAAVQQRSTATPATGSAQHRPSEMRGLCCFGP
jgi:pectin methylesterase-like acyl-CoA thioesterase